MNSVSKLVLPSLVLIGSVFASNAMACSTSSWNGGETGTPLADSPLVVSRVSGECAMALVEAGGVIDNSPSAETTANIRFYVFADLNSGAPVIFEAFPADDAGGTPLVTVTFDGTNFDFSAGGASSGNVPGAAGWNLIEMAWTGGSTMDYWVNADSTLDAATGNVAAAAGTMESVVLGATGTFDGSLTYDSYEARRSTPVGALLAGDGNNDDAINSGDINVVVNEFLSNNLGVGVPDCNLDGAVNSGDINCVVAIFLNL